MKTIDKNRLALDIANEVHSGLLDLTKEVQLILESLEDLNGTEEIPGIIDNLECQSGTIQAMLERLYSLEEEVIPEEETVPACDIEFFGFLRLAQQGYQDDRVFRLESPWTSYDVQIQLSRYISNDATAVSLVAADTERNRKQGIFPGEPVARLSYNSHQSVAAVDAPRYFFVKDYSENVGIPDWLMEHNIATSQIPVVGSDPFFRLNNPSEWTETVE